MRRPRRFVPFALSIALVLASATAAHAGAWRAETLDGAGGPAGRINGNTGFGPSAVVYGFQLHVFSVDIDGDDLRHSWWDGSTWRAETLDGNASGAGNRINAEIAPGTAAVVYAGQLHVFYHDETNDDLRHAFWTGSTWLREVLDGVANASLGRTGRDVGFDPTATFYFGVPHVYSYDAGAGALRHAWWTGSAWRAETLDGAGAPDVGLGASTLQYGAQADVFYRDTTSGNLRHAWYAPGLGWKTETLDGAGGPAGRISGDVGADTSSLVYRGGPHVFYRDAGNGGDLRHAWYAPGLGWYAEALDGTVADGAGRTGSDVGTGSAALLYGGLPHVVFDDLGQGDLRHGWWSGSAWRFERLDGHQNGPRGQILGDVGAQSAAVLYFGSTLHVFSIDEGNANLRHVWWDPTRIAPALSVQTGFLTGLNRPWDLGFLPDGTMFFTERSPTGRLRVRLPTGTLNDIATPADVVQGNEGGMLGLAVDPSFAVNRYVYSCFTSSLPGGDGDVRVVRWTVNATLDGVTARQDIVTGAPRTSGRHSGCRPRFGADGYLWVGTGDATVGTAPQNLSSLGGKVLRVDRNGAAAPGNFSGRLYTYGHRNVQGLAFRPGTGQPYGVEHGTGCDDEVNRLVNGGNYGWDPVPGYDESVPMTDFAKFPGAVAAVWSSGCPTIAPSGATFLSGAQWQQWDGALAVAVLKDTELRLFFLDGAGNVASDFVVPQLDLGVRLRSAVQGPDGSLYIATDVDGPGGAIWRVTPG